MQIQNFRRENIGYWTKRAAGYSAVNQEELATGQRMVWGDTLNALIAEHFGDRPPASLNVLDIGTGPGFFAILLARAGFAVTALDCTEAMLGEARKNAGDAAEKIQFLCGNAEEPPLADACFDVIVTRNLTWNLQQPEKAYAEWLRILKSSGLLLNFDANWYRFLYDDEAKNGHCEDRKNVAAHNAADDTAGTDVDAMEAIAKKAPLSQKLRPDWDIHTLTKLGASVTADTEIWRKVWTKDEWINNASTPMFLIRAVKR